MGHSVRLLAFGATVALAAATLPSVGAGAAPQDRVSGYVVVLEPDAGPPAQVAARLAERHGGQVGFVYRHALRGFSIRVSDRAADALANHPGVAYVEPETTVSVAEQTIPTGIRRVFATGNTAIDMDGTDDFRVDVDVAVIDTGIDLDHPDLNVAGSIDCTNTSGGPWFNQTVTCDAGGDDDHYHGTHVAGTVAAIDNGLGVVGVAPGARLWAVKVLESNGSGSNAMVIAGIDWVAARSSTIEVANLSLGGSYSQALNDSVRGARNVGVNVVVAAGNSSVNADTQSPASEPTAITVSALADFNGLAGGGAAATCRSDVDDTFASFSNYGTVVDMIAPGVCINSTSPGGGYRTISGTSMAAPHVAGAVALLRSMVGSTRSSAETTVIAKGNVDWFDSDDPDDTKERLLDVSDANAFAPVLVAPGGGEGGTTPPSTEVTFTGSSSSQGRTWTATVTVTNGTPDAAYIGTWSVGSSTATGCQVPASSTTCSFSRSGISKKTSSVTWTKDGAGAVVTIAKP